MCQGSALPLLLSPMGTEGGMVSFGHKNHHGCPDRLNVGLEAAAGGWHPHGTKGPCAACACRGICWDGTFFFLPPPDSLAQKFM